MFYLTIRVTEPPRSPFRLLLIERHMRHRLHDPAKDDKKLHTQRDPYDDPGHHSGQNPGTGPDPIDRHITINNITVKT